LGVKANRAYELIVSRESHEPAFLAGPQRVDRIELVSIDDGEAVLFWNLPAKEASKLVRELRGDLVGLDVEAFLDKWEGADHGADS
jgi:hypothetical protein